MTRRIFAVASAIAGLAPRAVFSEEMRDRETGIIISTPDSKGSFFVGVRTTLKASHYLAEVFYKTTVPELKSQVELLLHQESIGPVAGNEGYGATNQNFTCPRDKVEFVKVTFFQKLEEREFR